MPALLVYQVQVLWEEEQRSGYLEIPQLSVAPSLRAIMASECQSLHSLLNNPAVTSLSSDLLSMSPLLLVPS